MFSILDKNHRAILSDKKSAQWKVWVADVLKRHTAAPNVWIAAKLNMGAPQFVSMLTSRFNQHKEKRDAAYQEFIQNITKWPLLTSFCPLFGGEKTALQPSFHISPSFILFNLFRPVVSFDFHLILNLPEWVGNHRVIVIQLRHNWGNWIDLNSIESCWVVFCFWNLSCRKAFWFRKLLVKKPFRRRA